MNEIDYLKSRIAHLEKLVADQPAESFLRDELSYHRARLDSALRRPSKGKHENWYLLSDQQLRSLRELHARSLELANNVGTTLDHIL